MFNDDVLVKICKILNNDSIKNMAFINKKYYNFFQNNRNYVGLLKLKQLGFKIFNKDYNNMNIYNKIINLQNKKLGYQDLLMGAVYYGHLYIVKFLFENNIDISGNDSQALRYSAEFGYFEIVKFLVENCGEIHTYHDEPLRMSVKNGHLKIVKFLVEHGANIHEDNDYALEISKKNGDLQTFKYLSEQK